MVALDVATEDINRWLDHKKINEKKRQAYADNIDTLIESVSEGMLVVDEDCNLIQYLKFPIGVESKINELTFKPRINVASVRKHLQGVKATDIDGRILAYVAALTTQPKGVIDALDTEDYGIGQAIAVFFL